MSWQQYVARHKAGRSQVDLADLAEVSQTAVSRWLKGTQGVDAAVAIRFARAVGDEPLTALVEGGYLTLEEAGGTPDARADLSQLSNDQLLELVRDRMREAGGSDARDAAPSTRAEVSSAAEKMVSADFDEPPPPPAREASPRRRRARDPQGPA